MFSDVMRKRRIQKAFYSFLFIVFLYGLIVRYTGSKNTVVEHVRFSARPFSLYQCPSGSSADTTIQRHFAYNSEFKNETVLRVLLVADQDSTYSKVLADFIRYLKVPVRVEVLDKHDLLFELVAGRFSIIVFENYGLYMNLRGSEQDKLHAYCQGHKVGIISFFKDSVDGAKFSAQTSVAVSFKQQVTDIEFDNHSNIPFIGKKSVKLPIVQEEPNGWTVFNTKLSHWKPFISCIDYFEEHAAVAIHDDGAVSNVEHILFGNGLQHFIFKIAFWDALLFMSRGSTKWSLDTYLEIDIDDVFVGQIGTRLVPDDIDSMIRSQEFLRQHIEAFNYTLGFSGHLFKKGEAIENDADELLISKAEHFLWFPHMWHHNHAHEYELTYLLALMTQNELFAKNFNFRTILEYAVSPQHSGVYPVHTALYESWKQIWNVSVTSTEEYPHLKPAWNRRGFIHEGISVLPRQTCGLFTHTHHFHAYPDGIEQLKNNIFGGDLFSSILLNQFLIFMTHQQNYGHDRLAQYTFHNEVLFLKCWTNLKLKWVPPKRLAQLYFERYPEQREMVYTNPCADNRHSKMLNVNYTCDFKLPNVVIVGPQKTGTSALLSFLNLHPNVTSNVQVERSFEEMQFFGGFHYSKGFEWYKSKFNVSKEHSVVVEKTANYFDNPRTPELIHHLLPESKIIALLMDPTDRVYSWYYHMKSHNDSVAMKYSPEDLFSMTPEDVSYEATNSLRQRCLKPGHYAEHIDRWLDYFPPSQLLFIDAGTFRLNPAPILENLVSKLELPSTAFNYVDNLKYNKEKGFYCAVVNSRTKCLGASKGRKYSPMSDSLRRILNSYFAPHNRALYQLLTRYSFDIPDWLASLNS